MTTEHLTPLEETVARTLIGSDWDEGVRHTDIGSREDVAQYARDIVAAVYPIITDEVLRAEADALERAVPSEEAMPTMFVVPAHLWLRDRAEIRLRDAALRSGEKGTTTDAE